MTKDKDLALMLIFHALELLSKEPLHRPDTGSPKFPVEPAPSRYGAPYRKTRRTSRALVQKWFVDNPGKVVHVHDLLKFVQGVTRHSVLSACSKGVAEGLLTRVKMGWYKLASK